MMEGPEHRRNWYHKKVLADGARLEVMASHTTRRRLPTGHEYARQRMRGQPVRMIEQTDYSWPVLCNGKRVGTLKQLPNGSYFYGAHTFPRMKIAEAAEELVYRLGLARLPEPDERPPALKLG